MVYVLSDAINDNEFPLPSIDVLFQFIYSVLSVFNGMALWMAQKITAHRMKPKDFAILKHFMLHN